MAKTKKVNNKQDKEKKSKRKKILLGTLIPLGILAAGGAGFGIYYAVTHNQNWDKIYTTFYNNYKAEMDDHSATLYGSIELYQGSMIGDTPVTTGEITYDLDTLHVGAKFEGLDGELSFGGMTLDEIKAQNKTLEEAGYTITYTIESGFASYKAYKAEEDYKYVKFNNHGYVVEYKDYLAGNTVIDLTVSTHTEKSLIEVVKGSIDGDGCYITGTDYMKWRKPKEGFTYQVPEVIYYPEAETSYYVVGLADKAFEGCSASRISFEVPGRIKSINSGAFRNMKNLTSFDIPVLLEFIGANVFEGCDNLSAVNFNPDAGDLYPVAGSEPISKTTSPQQNATYFKNFIKGVNYNWGVTGLINYKSFGFFNIVTVDNVNVLSLTADGKAYDKKLHIPTEFKGLTVNRIAEEGFKDSQATAIEFVKTFDTQCSIGNSAFKGCTLIKSFVLPDNIGESVWPNTFEGCTNLKTISFGNNTSLKNIDSYAFKNCSSLVEVDLPATIKEILSLAFEGCTALKSVVIPNQSANWVQKTLSEPYPQINVTNADINATNLVNCTQGAENNWGYTGIMIKVD